MLREYRGERVRVRGEKRSKLPSEKTFKSTWSVVSAILLNLIPTPPDNPV